MASSDTAFGWVVKLSRASTESACALRLCAGVEVAETPAALWLRGPEADAALRKSLLSLPATGRFKPTADGKLQPEGSLLATDKMPDAVWTPIRAWARPELAPSRLPADPVGRVTPRLAPAGDAVRPSNAMILEFSDWRDWALQAPEARLERLSFAASASGRVLVRGAPTPSAPGRYFFEEDGVLLPAGMRCVPAVPAAVLRQAWRIGEGDVILWDEAGVRVLGRELFVPATRANVRATARARDEATRA